MFALVAPSISSQFTYAKLGQVITGLKELGFHTVIEGMACKDGCIGGAGCLTHGPKNKTQVDHYGMEAYEKTILEAVSVLDLVKPAAPASNPE